MLQQGKTGGTLKMKEDSKNDLFEKAPIPRAYFTFAR